MRCVQRAVKDSDIAIVSEALKENRTLVRMLSGRAATANRVDAFAQAVPFDVIVFATHAGEWRGERVAYTFLTERDANGGSWWTKHMGLVFDPRERRFMVQTFYGFREIDGVPWEDQEAKDRLPVGTAMTTWHGMSFEEQRATRLQVGRRLTGERRHGDADERRHLAASCPGFARVGGRSRAEQCLLIVS